jgi:hypothetical protein
VDRCLLPHQSERSQKAAVTDKQTAAQAAFFVGTAARNETNPKPGRLLYKKYKNK